MSNPGGQPPVDGTITGSDGAHLRIRLDGNKHSYVFHPTWKIEYLEAVPTGAASLIQEDE